MSQTAARMVGHRRGKAPLGCPRWRFFGSVFFAKKRNNTRYSESHVRTNGDGREDGARREITPHPPFHFREIVPLLPQEKAKLGKRVVYRLRNSARCSLRAIRESPLRICG